MQVYLKKQNFFFRKAVVRIGIFLIAVVALNIFQLQAKNIFLGASSPLSAALWQTSGNVSGVFAPFLNVKKIQSDNVALQAENQKLLSEILILKDSNVYYQEYQSALQNARTLNMTLKPAQVTGLDIAHDMATINKGSADGISENMAVMVGQNIIYGKIVRAYKDFSEVMLVSNKQSVIDVKIIGTSDNKNFIYGAVKGLGNLGFFLDLVDSNSHIEEGQALATSGLDGTFPSGLLVGNIGTVDHNDLKPFQTASVKLLVAPQNVENVFVVMKK